MIDIPAGFDLGQFMSDVFTVAGLVLPIIGLMAAFLIVKNVLKKAG